MTTARTLRGTAAPAPSRQPRSLLCFAQISDTHITDVSSPARVEYFAQVPSGVPLHRWPLFGAFRSNETLAPHTLAAMLIALAAASSPATGAAPSSASTPAMPATVPNGMSRAPSSRC